MGKQNEQTPETQATAEAIRTRGETAPTEYIIRCKNPKYCGVGAGDVQFANGTGKTLDPWVAQWHREKGYEVAENAIGEE